MIWMIQAALGAEISITDSDSVSDVVSTLLPGDTLVFASGNYALDGVDWTLIGRSDEPITLQAEAGAQFVIFPTDEGYPTAGINLVDSSWVVIDGFELGGDTDWESASFNGIHISSGEDIVIKNSVFSDIPSSQLLIDNEARRITVQDSRFRDTLSGSAIEIGCSDASCYTEEVSVIHNWIHAINGENEPAVHLHHGTQSAVINDNVIYNIESHGLYLGSTENGPANSAEGNAIWNINGSGLVGRGDALVRNNIIFNVTGYGIHFVDPSRDAYEEIVISFNSVVNTTAWGVYLGDWSEMTGNVLANNAVCNPVGQSIKLVDGEAEGDTGSVSSPYVGHFVVNNILCGQLDNLDFDFSHYIIGNGYADYIDVEGWNLYPSEESLLLDSADVSGQSYIPEYDFNGVLRNGSSPDIGAYEWDGFDNPGWQVQEGFKSFDLNYPIKDDVLGGGCCQEDNTEEQALLLFPVLLLGMLRRKER